MFIRRPAGNGWLSRWTLLEHQPNQAILELNSTGPGPFSYRAEMTYSVDPAALTITLSVETLAATDLPFGIGFHPWLPRTRDVDTGGG